MAKIEYKILTPADKENIELIAEWYLSEWKIPVQTTIEKTQMLSPNKNEFQVIMLLDGKPIATGGLYNHVGLLNKEPRLAVYQNWLGLVYTKPERRGMGFGTFICNFIQEHSRKLGLKQIYLFTHTAERLYRRLGWNELEKLEVDDKDIIVMKKKL